MMRGVLLVLLALLAGFQYDPHGHLYLTTEPNTADVVGTYVLDCFDLPTQTAAAHSMWGVYLRTSDYQFVSACCTGKKPPYGLIFTLGDPDSCNAVLLKRKQ